VDLLAAEERAREAVLSARARLLKFWHENIDDTMPLRVLRPDHICDRNGPAEGFIGENGYEAIAGIYPTCSHCGMVQVPGGDAVSEGVPGGDVTTEGVPGRDVTGASSVSY
jgi:hypothetical protein